MSDEIYVLGRPQVAVMGGSGGRSVQIKSEQIKINLTKGRVGRHIGAAMKNVIQAGIRAITVPVSEATLARRARAARARAPQELTETFIRVLQGKRKKRARKHLGKGTFANDTGWLADRLRVTWMQGEKQGIEYYYVRSPLERMNPDDFGGKDAGLARFRRRLFEYVPALNDGAIIWAHPLVQKAIEKEISQMFTKEPLR
jgi:hypothetical protein